MGLFNSKSEKENEKINFIKEIIGKYTHEIKEAVNMMYNDDEYACFCLFNSEGGLSGLMNTLVNKKTEELYIDSLIETVDIIEKKLKNPGALSNRELKQYIKKLEKHEGCPELYLKFKEIKKNNGFVCCNSYQIVRSDITREELSELESQQFRMSSERKKELEAKTEYNYSLTVAASSKDPTLRKIISEETYQHLLQEQEQNRKIAKEKYGLYLSS